MANDIQKILIIGGGPTEIGHETELDSGTVQIIQAFQKLGIRSLLIDNNPFSVALESVQPTNMFIQSVTTENVTRIIEREQPDAILPTAGGVSAISVCQELQETGVLAENNVQLLGIPSESLSVINNPERINAVLAQMNLPVIESESVGTLDEAITVAGRIGYPVIVKPVAPKIDMSRILCDTEADMIEAVSKGFKWSRFGQCVIEQSIVGLKEIEMVAIRDGRGTQLLISGLENIDPIGIHSGDSMVVAPTLTLTNQDYQRLRDTTFFIGTQFNFTGAMHIHFALDQAHDAYFVTKVTPYLDRGTALASTVTGYPIAFVSAMLYLQTNLTDVKLPDGYRYQQSLLLEPTLDHVTVRMPMWPFEDVPEADQHLSTVMHAVGSTIGVGRSAEEAILKALRSSQFSPRDELTSRSDLTDYEIISLLIHPLASRVLVLIEALRRGYQIDELAELTKIDPFYFHKLKHILAVEELIKSKPLDPTVLKEARYYGFGDGMIARLWRVDFDMVRQLANEHDITPTYKGIEPTAAEFPSQTSTFYSTFENENESTQLSEHTALVLGRGGNQLGPNASADYFTTEMLKQLNKSGYKTVTINTNSNAGSLMKSLTDKQYIEPIQLGDVLNVVQIEHPEVIFVPGNRHYLTRELRARKLPVAVLPPDQEQRSELVYDHAEIGLDLFVTAQHTVPILLSDLRSEQGLATSLSQLTVMKTPSQVTTPQFDEILSHATNYLTGHPRTGLVQLLYTIERGKAIFAGIRPTRLTAIAFLNKVTGINWIRMLVRQALGEIDEALIADLPLDIRSNRIAVLRGTFPFKQLQVPEKLGLTTQEVGAKIGFGTAEETDLTD